MWPEERRAQRRERLMAAALELFGRAGYQATTIAALCRQAGITTVHFYELFASREAVLRSLLEELVSEAQTAVTNALAVAPDDREQRTRAGVSAFVHAMLDDPRRARVECIESVGVSEELETFRSEVLGHYTRLLQIEAIRMASHEGGSPTQHHYIATALVGGTNEVMVQWLTDDNPPPIEDLVEELTDMFVVVGRTFVASEAPFGYEFS